MATIGDAANPPRLTQRQRGADEPVTPDDPGREPAFLDLAALERRAQEQLPADVYDYYAGGSGAETTLAEATAAWRAWRLRPHVLRGVDAVQLGTTLLGTAVATPIGVAPWAYQGMAHPDGERATARGAAATGALMTVSTSANTSVEDAAAVRPPGPRWFQLYAVHSPAYTDELARRAGRAGYTALVLTVDLPVLGRRLRDLRNDFALPAGLLLANQPPVQDAPRTLEAAPFPSWTHRDIGRFAELSGLPVVVKGVLRGDDAEVYADGGIRSGSDVVTALALGARAVFVGRPAAWGLATAGADGVARVLAGLTEELAHTMALCGLDDVRAVPRDTVVRTRLLP